MLQHQLEFDRTYDSMEALKNSGHLRHRCCPLRNCSRPIHRTHLCRILHHFSPTDLSHAVSNPARHWMGNRCDVVGRGVFRCADDRGSTGWFPPNVTSIGTLAFHRVVARLYGCQRGAVRYYRVCTGSKRSAVDGLADVLPLASDALPFHGRLVGALGFLRGCFRWGCRPLRDYISQTTTPRIGLSALVDRALRFFTNQGTRCLRSG
jgi:hypothetical protein